VWAEEPARRWDYRGLRLVSRSIASAVATGENLCDVSEFTPLVANEAVDVVQIGANTSGITGALQVAELAYAFELPVAMMNCPGRFTAHLAAALSHHSMMEVLDAGRDVTFTADNLVEDGWIVLGDSPGAGITFDEEKLRAHAMNSTSQDTIGAVYRRGDRAGVHEGSRPPGSDR
jgi:L-alanine-DL-glutamate epimerase-like enolase superfamily enzyme